MRDGDKFFFQDEPMDLLDLLDPLIPNSLEKEFLQGDLSLTLDPTQLQVKVVNDGLHVVGPLDIIVKSDDIIITNYTSDLVGTLAFSLKNFAITSTLDLKIEDTLNEHRKLTHLLRHLLANPWTEMFEDGKPLSDFEERLKMAGGILADTTINFKNTGEEGWLYGGFLLASEVHRY